MAENMQVEQTTEAGNHGVVIRTTIKCGLLYQSERVISYIDMSKIENVPAFLSGERAAEARKVFTSVWEKIRG